MDERIRVAAVCGNEVRIYGERSPWSDRRGLIQVLTLPHHGAALQYAHEYEEAQRGLQERPGKV